MFFCPLEMASDCHELFLRGETTSGIYIIQPMDAEPFKVFCEMTAGKWSKNWCQHRLMQTDEILHRKLLLRLIQLSPICLSVQMVAGL